MSGNSAAQIVGGVVGFAVGGPVGASIGMSVGGALVPPPPMKQQGPRLSDLTVSASTYGAALPKIHGTNRTGTNLIWSAGIKETAKKETQGGKGGPSVETTTYSYSASFAVGVCRGPANIVRVWADAVLIYEAGAVAQRYAQHMTIHPGAEDQAPSATIQAHEGADATPAYRGLCYLVFEDLPLEKWGNRIPSISVEVSTAKAFSLADLQKTGETLTSAAPETHVSYVYSDGSVLLCRLEHEADEGRLPHATNFHFEKVRPDGTRVHVADVRRVGWYSGGPAGALQGVGSYSDKPGVVLFKQARAGEAAGSATGAESVAFIGIDDKGTSAPLAEAPLTVAASASYLGGKFVLWRRPRGPSSGEPGVLHASYGAPGIVPMHTVPSTISSAIALAQVTPTVAYALAYVAGKAEPQAVQLYVGNVAVAVDSERPAGAGAPGAGERRPTLARGFLLFEDAGSAIAVDTRTGAVERHPMPSARGLPGAGIYQPMTTLSLAGGRVLRVGLQPRSVSGAADYSHLAAEVFTGPQLDTGDTLDAVVSDICMRAGYAEGELDTSALAGITVRGYTEPPGTARDKLHTLQQAYLFDVAERGGQLVFVKRGMPADAVITEEELGAGDGETAGDLIRLARVQDLELPRRVTVSYVDAARQYEPGTQYAARIAEGEAVAEVALELPIVLTATEALQIAELTLYDTWRSRETVELTTTAERLEELLAADVLTVEQGGDAFRVRVTRADYEAPGLIRVAGVIEGSGAYVSDAVAEELPLPAPRVLLEPSATAFELIDAPLFSDAQPETGILLAAHPTDPSREWRGAVVSVSEDGGATWSAATTVTRAATVGTLAASLPAAAASVLDRGSVLLVELHPSAGPLVSVTEAQAAGGANAALVGDELVTFAHAEQVSDTVWQLTGLTRSRRGTPPAAHAPGARFVLLDAAIPVPLRPDLIGAPLLVTATTTGMPLATDAAQQLTYAGAALRPYAPAHLRAVPTPASASGTYSLTWQRRTRRGGEWRDLVDAPLSEASEMYRVRVTRAGVAIYDMTHTAPEAHGVPGQAGDVATVQQLSELAGPGFPASITL